MKLKRIISLSLITVMTLSATGITDKLKAGFGESRVLANQTSGGEWKDPGSGITYYSGGSLVVKFKPATFEPWFSARAPSFNIGCSGFSFDLGFASIIDMDKLTDQLSSAGTSLIGGFMSSILYSTPILGDIIKTVKKVAAVIEKLLQSACAIGKTFGRMAAGTNSKITDNESKKDPSGWVNAVSDLGMGAGLDSFNTDMNNFTKGIECYSKKDTQACLKSKDSEGTNMMEEVSNILAPKSIIGDANDASVVANIVDAKALRATDVFIDKISLVKLMKNQASVNGMIEQSYKLKQYGPKIIELMIVASGGRVAPNATCNLLRHNLKSLSNIGDSSPSEIADLIKKNMNKKDSSPSPKTYSSTFTIKVKNGKAIKDLFIDFLNNGTQLLIPNFDLFVVNKSKKDTASVIALDGTDYTNTKYIFVCSPEKGAGYYETTWNGLDSVENVQGKINNIINAETTTNTNDGSVLLSETVRLAQALIKRNKLKKEGISVLPTYLSSYTLALFNQFMITQVIYDAIVDAYKNLNDSTNNSTGISEDVQVELDKLEKKRKEILLKMQKNIGKIDLIATLRREAVSIEKEYKEETLKRTQR